MSFKFIDVLHRGRRQRKSARTDLLQLIEAYTRISAQSHPHPARDVQAAPQRPPVQDKLRG